VSKTEQFALGVDAMILPRGGDIGKGWAEAESVMPNDLLDNFASLLFCKTARLL
jgi:hypothetical protein